MNVGEMKSFLKGFDDNREVVVHDWSQDGSQFFILNPSATPTTNSTNALVLTANGGTILLERKTAVNYNDAKHFANVHPQTGSETPESIKEATFEAVRGERK